jgi:hypothetical protein
MSDHAAPSGEKASLLSNILAIIGLIILVIIIVWGLVHIAELSSGWFTSLFPNSGPSIKVNAPSDAASGAPVTVSWNYSTSAAGSYAFLYQCQSGFQFAVINTTNNTASGIPCGASFQITPSNQSIQILPLLSGTTSASVPFSVLFIPTSGTQVEGSATITIHPGSGIATTQPASGSQTQTSTTKPASTVTTSAPRAYSYKGPADLSVHVISANIDQYGNGVVTFSVSNVGGSRSGSYSFTAQYPTTGYSYGYGVTGQSAAPYISSTQAPLPAGGYIVNTLRFSQATGGVFSVALSAADGNQSNNYASQYMSGLQTPNYGYGYNYNYNYNAYNNYNPYNVQYQTYPYTY